MGENKFSKLGFMALYLALSGVSCWATAESLMLLQPQIPGVVWWIVAIGLFIMASFGTKMMYDSLRNECFQENPMTKLLIGLVLFLLTWLCCSMPTNTHTFFYRSYVGAKVSNDITITNGYLAQIKNDQVISTLIQEKQNKLESDVMLKFGELEAEIKNSANPGFGPKSREILASFANMLGVANIEPLAIGGLDEASRQRLVVAYRNKILILLNNKKENIKNSLTKRNKEYKKVAAVDFRNLEKCRAYVQDGTLDLNKPKDIQQVCNQLDRGYATIKTYHDYVTFPNENEKARYLADNPETKVRRLLSVFDVWRDFLKGEYPGSFWFWIILSVLVDLSAFFCFSKATTNDDF